MELELGLVVPSTGTRADVLLSVDEGTPLAAVEAELLSLVLPHEGRSELWVGEARLTGREPLGRPPLVHGAVLTIGARPAVAVSGFALHCVGGPDAGGAWPLPSQEAVLGRGAGVALRVDDPLLSRAHCGLRVVDGAVVVRDLGATNGTTVDGAAVTTSCVPLPVGAVLCAGGSRFTLVAEEKDTASTRPDGSGSLTVHRPPRAQLAVEHAPVHFPEAPVARERRPLPVLAVLAPLVLGVVLWRVLGSATFLLFTLLSPVLVVGSAVTDARTGRRQHRRAVESHRRETAAAAEQLREAVHADQRVRRARWPDPAAALRTARSPGARLWERRRADDDALTVALGNAAQPTAVPVSGRPPPGTTTCDAPVVVPLGEHGVLGVAGEQGLARALARWVVAQAAVWHSPRDLQLVVLTSTGAAADWQWTRWLPHLRPTDGQACRALLGIGVEQAAARVSELRTLLAQRQAEPRRRSPPRPVLLVVDGGAALRDLPGLADVLADGPAAGVHAVVVEDDRRLLPASCGALALVDGAARLELVVAGRVVLTDAAVDGLSTSAAEALARALAPLRDTGPDEGAGAALPRTVGWAELQGLPLRGGEADVDAVVQRWRQGGGTRAVIGLAADGPFAVDLCADGPHALVAGTTGSGKSELLQTWIASLVLGNPPDALSLVLVDYKGGAAFGPCARLPHVVGMVTDLDGPLAARALASLGAELRRRERLLAASGARDLEEHRRRAGPPLPRLVLVVDEFAALAEELPDFVGGLVDIAMRGRSLGVHLVLATQRPGGVVSADIRANTNLRLCLAVSRDTDSRDVLDSPAAAHLNRAAPGRGYVRTGHAEMTAVQIARVSGRRPPVDEDRAPRVILLPAVELGEPPQHAAAGAGDDGSELTMLVDACAAAAARLGLPAPFAPWLPALPTRLVLADLPPYDDPLAARPGRLPPLAHGLLDLPEQQRQCPLLLDLDRSTHLLVVGAPRSGRTTVLRTLAGALAATAPPDDVHLYVVDATGHGLAALADLPHTGAVVTRGDTDRLERLLGWLTAEVRRRQQALATAGAASLAEQRAHAAPAARLPALLLLLDGFDALVADHQDRDAGRLVDAVHALLRDGAGAGLHVVLTGGRSALSGRLASLVDRRLVLRMADRADSALAGVPDRLVEPAPEPGRGWLVDGDGCSAAQVALLDADATGSAQADALAVVARRHGAAAFHRPHAFRPLPQLVVRDDLPLPTPLASGCVVLGAGGDDGAPVVVDVRAGFLLAGPPGSGRSTALCTVGAGLRDGGLPAVGIALRPSPLRQLADDCLTDEDVHRLGDLLGRGPRAVLVDDAELLAQSPLAPVLEATVRQARDTGHVVVAAGTTDDLVLGYRGFVVDLRRSRSGVLLSPEPADGELLGVRLPRSGTPPRIPGRGLLCRRGVAEPLQVAR